MERIGHWIGGKVVPGESGITGPVFNPATGEQTHEVDFATVEEFDRAVEIAKEAFPEWRGMPLSQRGGRVFPGPAGARAPQARPRARPPPPRRTGTCRVGS